MRPGHGAGPTCRARAGRRRAAAGPARALVGGLALVLALVIAGPASADASLALDKGCFNCHGNPPRRGAPTFDRLVAECVAHRGDDAAIRRLAERLRSGSIFGHVDAHERLSAAEAERLMRWIVEGAPGR